MALFRIAVIPLLALVFIAQIALGVLRQPFLSWNEIRITRAIALARGLPLYLGQFEKGAIIGTLHTPFSHFFYTFTNWIPNPTTGILAASGMSVLLTFLPLLWVLQDHGRHFGANWKTIALVFFLCGFTILQSHGTYNIAFMIHTDAAAIALATIACALLARSPQGCSGVALWVAAFCTGLSVLSKQTMLPIAFAGAAFLWFADGKARLVRYGLRLLIAASTLVCASLLMFPPRAFFFNVVTLALHRPLSKEAVPLFAEIFRIAKMDSLLALIAIVFFAAHHWTQQEDGPSLLKKSRAFAAQHRWLIFVLFGASLIPGSAKAVVTAWADVNHVGLVLFFWFTAMGLALQRHLNAPDAFLRKSARIFLALGLLMSIAPGALLSLPSAYRELWNNDAEIAYNYAVKHPGAAYFPKSPEAALLTEGKLYHLDAALRDREGDGYPLSDQQLLSGLPQRYRFVAVPPGQALESFAFARMFTGYHRTIDPELPGWTVYQRP